ncbi:MULTISPECIES: Fe2+-dependent dioxygenase [Planktothrix]|jgi:PKHD-type hydroxylase|uniref:Fe2OG dioxygenase domain-containing protein n=2 Tax=Planktothrix TaxID=54304 RepID=A0A4P5ZBW7_PLAAG|nr:MULTISPECIES: Fe2+-dependent dioxygenase [Planktothrix]CAD5948176.1 PKHD-type hydroxylase tll1907 [Planktothrix rubescens]CAC5344518.1 putative enzyme [Planktothrix rubescens NIVA-CYA 18]CAD5918295.1 PKHD-type hydroxylase tll1907 [Planktothrix rubescens NIVA-CYA 18]CAD5963739.1 PKHD-type hydroxylase tll1907 [Planktothrix agardhii]CAH2571057.1 PKHD-type hydroxylase tll1907 [Planktothrix rubescens]
MIFCIADVLTPEELETTLTLLQQAEFIDGKTTAGRYVKSVKNNQQIKTDTEITSELRNIVLEALKRNELFQVAARPKIIRPIIFSRYDVGMYYGSHFDNAIMGDESISRSDVSLTLFLTDPNTYQGGELVIETSLGEQSFKLDAGSAIVYPSSTLHRVETVTEGTRWAAVTWIQSLIRDPSQREILFDLDTARRSIFQQYGKTIEFDLIAKSHANLLRKWADI